MLKLHLCQNCGSKIDSATAFFCSNCGLLLVEKPSSAAPEPNPTTPNRIQKNGLHTRRNVLRLAGIAVVTLAILFFALLLLRPYLAKFVESPTSTILLTDFHFAAPNELLEKPFFSEMVPDGIDFYLTGQQLIPLLEKIFKTEEQRLFEKTVGLTLTEATSYLEPGFAFFGKGEGLAFISQIRTREFVEQKIKEVEDNTPSAIWHPYLWGNYLLVTNEESLANEAKEALDKKRLNISLRASFAEGWRSLPHQGQYFLHAADRQSLAKILNLLFGQNLGTLAKDEIRGQAVIISTTPKGTYLQYGK